MEEEGQRPENLFKTAITPKIILIFGLIVASALSYYLHKQIKEKVVRNNSERFKDIINDFKMSLNQYVHPLEGNAAMYVSNNFKLSQKDFRKAAESRNFFKNFDGAVGFGFIRYVKQNDLNNYVKKQKAENKNFQLKRFSNGNISERGDYFIIETIEPIEKNSKALGLVISDEFNRKEAALQSMISGEPTLTKSIELVQNNKKEPGFLFMKPVYKTGYVPKTEAERIENIVGWTYAPIIASEIGKFISVKNYSLPYFKIYEVRTESKDRILFEKVSKNEAFDFDYGQEIKFYGVRWRFESSLNYYHSVTSEKYIPLLVFAILSTIFYLIYLNLTYAERRLKLKITNEERLKNKIDEAVKDLKHQKKFLDDIVNNVPSLIGYWDADLINQFSNKEYCSFVGMTSEELKGKHVSEVYGRNNIQEDYLSPLNHALAGEVQFFERELTNIMGEKIFVQIKYVPDFKENKVSGIFVIAQNVTDLKRSNLELHQLSHILKDKEIFLTEVLNSVDMNFVYLNKDLEIENYNENFKTEWGKTTQELTHAHISQIIPPNLYAENFDSYKRALKGEKIVVERSFVKGDNKRKILKLRMVPHRIDNEVKGLIASATDITDYVNKNAQVELLYKAIDYSPIAIEITDKDEKIEYVNKAYLEHSGYQIQELIGKRPSVMASGKTPRENLLELKNKIHKGETWSGEFINVKKNGDEMIEEAMISPIRNNLNEVTHYLGIKKDITKERELEKVNKENEQKLIFNSKLASIGEMAAGVAHEINNPLASISLQINSMVKKMNREGISPEEMKTGFERVNTNIFRISKIITSLKLYTKDTTDNDFKKISAHALTERVMDLCFEKIKFKDVKFEVLPFIDFEVECNEIKVQQVLVNLINNAFDAVENNSDRWIKLSVENIEGYAYFKVVDSGHISKEVAEKIFAPFFTTKELGKGTGLGLSISMNIAKEHQGELYTDLNQANTCFVLKIPINPHMEQALLESIKKAS